MVRDSVCSIALPGLVLGAALAAALVSGAPVAAQPSAEAEADATAPAAPRNERRRDRERRRAAAEKQATAAAEPTGTEVICKDYKPTGSRMAKRICATADQWAATGRTTSAQASETMRKMREQSSIAIGSSSSGASAPGN